MNSTLKVFAILIAFFTLTFIGLIIGLNVHAQTIDLTQEQAVLIQQIKNRSDDILYSEEKQIGIYDGRELIATEPVVDYAYKDLEVDATNIVFDDSQYSSIEKINDQLYKVWTEPHYYKNDNGQVQEIIHERTSQQIWQETLIQTTTEKIEALLKTPYILADSYSSGSDGYVGNVAQTSYALARNTTPSSINSDAETYIEAQQHESNKFAITRALFHFDTSAIDDTYSIGTSSLFLYGYNNKSGSENYNLYTSSSTSLTTGSFFQFNSTPLATNISATDFNVAGYNEFILNSTGTSTISKTGTSAFMLRQVDYDVNNSAPPNNLYKVIAVQSSATAGTDKDPYLLVNLIAPEEEEEETTSSSTPQFLTCSPQKNNELSVITGCAVENNGTATTTISYVFHIPFIVWLILFLLVAFIGERLIVEFLIRWRK